MDILTDDFNAVHIRADSTEERNRMRGSKYIQSRLGNTFKNVKVDLDAQRSVLFLWNFLSGSRIGKIHWKRV